MRVKMKRGELPVKTVYGYRKINNELTIFDKEANVVKWILHEYLRGRTLKQIKELLENFNIKSPSIEKVYIKNNHDFKRIFWKGSKI